MKRSAIHVALLLVGLPSIVTAGRDQSHPVVKVINLLKGLRAKTVSMGKVEAASYAKFQGWCKDTTSTLSKAISDEKDKITELGDTIAGKSKEQEGLEKQISDLSDEIADIDASALKAKNVRADEEALYKKSLEDYKGTIKAVGEAVEGVKKAGTTTKTEFLQAQKKAQQALAVLGAFATEEQRTAINSFVQDGASQKPLLAKGDKSAALSKYNFKSGNVLDLLEAMKKSFEEQKRAATQAETNAMKAYELSSKALENSRTAADASRSKKTTELAEAKKALADAKSNLKNQKQDLDADSASLAETDKSSRTKQQEWETRSKTRSLELEAMDTAVKILAKVTGVRTKKPNNPKAPASPVLMEEEAGSFLQLSDTPTRNGRQNAVNLLRKTASQLHSRSLERLATEISAHLDGPLKGKAFDQINNSVEKMIFRLMAEQTNEDNHKSWCDQELAKTKAMKDNKDDKIQELDAEIKMETTSVGQLTQDIQAADTMISNIVASTKKATEIRNAGKKENKAAIADAENAQKAILVAIGTLQAFYQDSGQIKDGTFLEAPVNLPKSPSTWDSGYTGVADPTKQPGGIIAVLKAVNADFEKLEAETKSQETTDQQVFDEQIQKETIEKARRSKEVEMKSNRKMQKADAITQMTSTRKNVASEQEKVVQYLKDLQPACGVGDSSYADRKKARNAEIDALQKAQAFLSNASDGKKAAFLSKAEVHMQTLA